MSFQKGHKINLGRKRVDMIGNKYTEGLVPWNKGIPLSEETKRKLRKSLKGRKVWNKGKHYTLEQKKTGKNSICKNCGKEFYVSGWQLKMGIGNYCSRKCYFAFGIKKIKCNGCGKEFIARKSTLKHKRYCSKKCSNKYVRGENAGKRWKGGIAKSPYAQDWTKTLRLAIRQRDNFTCQKCGITEEEHIKKYNRVLSVNHIDYDKKNCDPKNLNTLCCYCNTQVNFNREYWTTYFQEKLLITNFLIK